jgi:hypothetical protein
VVLRVLAVAAALAPGFHARVQPIPPAMRAAPAQVVVSRRLDAANFPIRRMEPIDLYSGDDFSSIEADNTSAFNCRAATGSTHWSNHAYGSAR